MSHKHNTVVAGPISERDLSRLREAVCIQVEKIYDSCREKDCIEDAPVLFRHPDKIQKLLNSAINVKARLAEVKDVYADVEEVPFKRGFFTVDVKFFIKVVLDFFVPNSRGGTGIVTVPGLVLFDKKVILFGSEGSVKIFKSHYTARGIDTPIKSDLQQDNLPISKIEVAEPIALAARIVEEKHKCCCPDNVPRFILDDLDRGYDDIDDDIVETESANRFANHQVLASIGLFSIIKLVRFVQLLIPAFDFCVPNRECIAATEENACDLFDTIDFPVDEFFPPQKFDFPGAVEDEGKFRTEDN